MGTLYCKLTITVCVSAFLLFLQCFLFRDGVTTKKFYWNSQYIVLFVQWTLFGYEATVKKLYCAL